MKAEGSTFDACLHELCGSRPVDFCVTNIARNTSVIITLSF